MLLAHQNISQLEASGVEQKLADCFYCMRIYRSLALQQCSAPGATPPRAPQKRAFNLNGTCSAPQDPNGTTLAAVEAADSLQTSAVDRSLCARPAQVVGVRRSLGATIGVRAPSLGQSLAVESGTEPTARLFKLQQLASTESTKRTT